MDAPTAASDGEALKARLTAIVQERASAQVEWRRSLARFPSTRGNDEARQRWLAAEFARRGWAVDLDRLGEVDMDGLPGHSPVSGVDCDRLRQLVATPPTGQGGRSPMLQGLSTSCLPAR